MACQTCGSERIASISAKCSDLCYVESLTEDYVHDGYVPSELGIGDKGGDY